MSYLQVAFPRWVLEMILRHRFGKGLYGSIVIADLDTSRSRDGLFFAFICEALELIERSDPRRFRRLQQHIHAIANLPLAAGAEYGIWLHSCYIDFSRFEPESVREHRERYVAYLAGVLVHEATHGYLHSLGFTYTATSWQRHEQICSDEQNRFVRRLRAPNKTWPDMIYRFHGKTVGTG